MKGNAEGKRIIDFAVFYNMVIANKSLISDENNHV